MYINGNLYYRNNYRYYKMYKGSILEWIKFFKLNYLYFYANQDSTVEWTTDGSISPNLEYSTDGENFTEWDYSTISVPANSTIYFRGQNMDIDSISDANNHFNILGDINIGGDIGSIFYATDSNIMFDLYNATALFKNCYGIVKINDDFESATYIPNIRIQNNFRGCSNLSQIPTFMNFSNCYDVSGLFSSCTNLSLPTTTTLHTPKNVSTNSMFNECDGCIYAPEMDTTNVTHCGWMFQMCDNLIEVPVYNTVNSTNFTSMFWRDSKLKTVGGLDFTKGTAFTNIFTYCSELENITLTGSINYTIDFRYCRKLTYDSVKSILTAASNTTRTTSSKTLTFRRTLTDNNGELAALVTACTSKRWTISGLTLE